MHKTDIYMTASYLFQHWFWDISISDWPVLVTFSFFSQFWLTNSSLHDFAWIKKVEISPQWHFTVIRNTVRRDGDNNFDEILGFWNILLLLVSKRSRWCTHCQTQLKATEDNKLFNYLSFNNLQEWCYNEEASCYTSSSFSSDLWSNIK